MNYKERRTNNFIQKDKFQTKIQKSTKQLPEQYPTLFSKRMVIQHVKENFRSGSFGIKVGRVFYGNSNKSHLFMQEKINNRVQKRNQIAKNFKYYD